jgi:hypothetical protein
VQRWRGIGVVCVVAAVDLVVVIRIGLGTTVDQGAQHLQARFVGEVQVVDDQAAQWVGVLVLALNLRLQQGPQGALHHQTLALAGGRGHTGIDLGQHPRDGVARGGRQGGGGRGAVERHHGAQQTRERGEGHTGIPGAAGRTHHAGVALGKGLQQPRLAEARLADQGDDLAAAPGGIQRGQFGIAPDQAWWAQHARGHRPVAGGHARFIHRLHGREQGQRLR